jgi:hypothetical protein
MLRTARLTEAMRAHGKTLAVSAAVAGVLAGAGSASAALTSSPTSVTAHLAAVHAAPNTHQAALTAADVTASTTQAKTQSDAATKLFPIGHTTPTVKTVKVHQNGAAAPAQAAAPAPQAAPAPAPAPPAQPSTIYDSVTPSSIPAGAQAAVYSDGTYAATPTQVAGHPNTLWIDTNGSNPKANVLDVEPGDATPQQAATWVQQKLSASPNDTAIVYTYRAEWGATQQAISALPQQMQSHVKWWIADPTGVPHIVPGSDATQWYWGQNYDQSLANPGF